MEILRIDAEEIEEKGAEAMIGSVDGILVPGGFGDRGIEGKIQTVEYARTKGIPFLGICMGMQVAVIEYARHICGMDDANSTEFDQKTTHPVISLQEDCLLYTSCDPQAFQKYLEEGDLDFAYEMDETSRFLSLIHI